MKKFFGILMIFLSVIAMVRFIAWTNSGQPEENKKLDLVRSLEEVDNFESIFEFDEFYVDVQKLEYNFTSISNGLKANPGEQYTYYKWVSGDHGSHAASSIIIEDVEGIEIGHFQVLDKSKPEYEEGVIEWIQYIGEMIQFIGLTLVNLGELLIDLFLALIMAIVRIAQLLYIICFKF